MAENTCNIGNNSPVLNNLFGDQPCFESYAFRTKCDELINLYAPKLAQSPEVLACYNNISYISDSLLSCAVESRKNLTELFIQTCYDKHLNNYSTQANACNNSQLSCVSDNMHGH